MKAEDVAALARPELQSTFFAEAVTAADVGFLIWDDDRRYIAANATACRILGCTLEQLIGSPVGARTEGGEEAVQRVVGDGGGTGRLTVERFDGERVTLGYVTFATRTASMPYMASVIWPEDDAPG